jgi:uncharacterized membrane protein YjfL (UPF0719 family)
MDIQWAPLANAVVASVLYSVIGIVMFALSFFAINTMSPFSIRKEIEEDHNTALGIVIAAVILGLSMIIAAAVG